MRGISRFVVVLWACLATIPAQAQLSASETEQLKRHFDLGTKAFNLGEFKRAVDEYKAAYNIKSDPVFLYNIAQAYRLDGNLQQALFFYKSYLSNSPQAPNRAEVEGRIEQLDKQVAAQRALATAPPTTTVSPKGVSPSEAEPRREPAPPATATEAPPANAATPTTAPRTDGAAALTASAPPAKTPLYKKWWLWTAVGVVAAGAIGVGLGLGLSSPSAPGSTLGTTRVF